MSSWKPPAIRSAITNVFDNHINDPAPTNVTVTIQLSGSLGAQEKVWVRFATNSGSAELAGSRLRQLDHFTATIPPQPSGTRVRYYVLTSTMPSNIITSEFDLTLLRGKKSGTSNYFLPCRPR
jgi:hypothetical protein